jgi:FHA domain-containing protein
MIRFRVLSIAGKASIHEIAADFDEMGGTIGRATTNQLVLPDPQRQISREHATVAFREGRYVIVDQGSAIPVHVNGRALGNGKESPIRDGDEVRIGDYTLQVSISPARSAASPSPGHVVTPRNRQNRPDSPPANFGAMSNGDFDPFGDAANHPSGGSSSATGERAPKETSAADTHPSGAAKIPEDFDPFADKYAAEPLYAEPNLTRKAPADDSSIQASLSSDVQSIDSLFGLASADRGQIFEAGRALDESSFSQKASHQDHVPEIHGSFRPPKPEVRPAPDPLLGMFGEDTGRDVLGMGAPPSAPSVPEPKAASLKKSAPAPRGAPAIDASRQPGGPSAVGMADDALVRAFLTGLGTAQLRLPNGLTPEVMHLVGMLMREAVQGTLDLLLARATSKREMRAVVTMIAGRDNNPLKFSPSVDVALMNLLGPQGPGFLPPEEAMRDAYDDLRAHAFGFMAGMRAALAGVLARFSPERLEQRLSRKTALDSLLLMNRKAKLWDLFNDKYQEISQEVEQDFHELFGREFLRAYEEQVARLRATNGKK